MPFINNIRNYSASKGIGGGLFGGGAAKQPPPPTYQQGYLSSN